MIMKKLNPKDNDSNPVMKVGKLGKVVALLMTAAFMFRGIMVITTEHFYSKTKSGTETIIDGEQAIIMGIGFMFLGLLPMTFWAKTPKAAAWIAGFSIFLGVITMVLSKFWASLIFR